MYATRFDEFTSYEVIYKSGFLLDPRFFRIFYQMAVDILLHIPNSKRICMSLLRTKSTQFIYGTIAKKLFTKLYLQPKVFPEMISYIEKSLSSQKSISLLQKTFSKETFRSIQCREIGNLV